MKKEIAESPLTGVSWQSLASAPQVAGPAFPVSIQSLWLCFLHSKAQQGGDVGQLLALVDVFNFSNVSTFQIYSKKVGLYQELTN